MGNDRMPGGRRHWRPTVGVLLLAMILPAALGVLLADAPGDAPSRAAPLPTGGPGPPPAATPSTEIVVRGRLADERFQGIPGLAQAFAEGGEMIPGAGKVEDGGFVLRVSPPTPETRCFVILTPFTGIRAFASAFDPIVLDRTAAAGPLDLGVVPSAGSGPVCVRGRVVDADGAPVAAVRVRFLLMRARSSVDVELSAPPTGADGRFEWRAHVHGVETLRVDAEPPWNALREVECRPGATDVEIRVARSLARGITVELPPGFPSDGLVVQITGPGAVLQGSVRVEGGRWTSDSSHIEFDARNRTVVTGLREGTYDLILRRKGTSAALAALRGWDPQFGDPPPLTPDPATTLVTVTVIGPDDAPAPGARVWLRESGRLDRFGTSVTADSEGRVTLPRARPGGTVAAAAPGLGFAFADADGAAVTLRLQHTPPTEIVIRMPRGYRPPGAGTGHGVRLQWAGEADGDPRRVADGDDPRAETPIDAEVDRDGVARAVVPVPGWYEVTAATSSDRSRRWQSPGGPFRVRVTGKQRSIEAAAPAEWRRAFDD